MVTKNFHPFYKYCFKKYLYFINLHQTFENAEKKHINKAYKISKLLIKNLIDRKINKLGINKIYSKADIKIV